LQCLCFDDRTKKHKTEISDAVTKVSANLTADNEADEHWRCHF
jgi:hypothetical protein